MNKRFCQAGSSHIWLRQNNEAQLCCSLAHSVDDHMVKLEKTEDFFSLITSKQWTKKYRQLKKGPLSDGLCNICLTEDQKNNGSQRKKLKNETLNGSKFFLKIDFSNKCNLKCTMCSSARSTAWIKDEQKINNLVTDPVLQVPVFPYETLDDKWWEKIPLEWWKNLGAVEISGGEPLYQKEALDFIDFLSVNVPTCRLRIITNATLIDDKILSILNCFDNIGFICSVDAWEDNIYRYVRGDNYGIDVVKENITELFKMVKTKELGRIGVCDTFHVINYDQMSLGKKWVKQFDSPVIKYNPNYVYKPHHLDYRRVLPKDICADSKPDLKLQKRFYEFITSMDKVRGTDVLEIRPEFETWFEQLKDIK